jgi:simple sugar transport system permease protein
MKARTLPGPLREFGLPRIIILLFLVVIWIYAAALGMPFFDLLYDCLVRTGMWIPLVLAMMPGILSGIGLNFGLPLGILCGLIGALLSIELNMRGFPAFLAAIAFSLPLSAGVGYLYGQLLNRVKGSEMMVATYTGFGMVSLLCIGWLVLPFRSPEMAWPIGVGVRVTITLAGRFDKILNDLAVLSIGPLRLMIGLFAFNLLLCFLVWLFFRTRTGIGIIAAGDNPRYAESCGISVDRSRIIGTMLSTILGGIGILVYAQSFGFLQLYQGPMMMAFPAVACILIGGASIRKAGIVNVLLGTFLFQSILVTAMPLANLLAADTSNLAEITRLIIQNGIILYALAQAGRQE